MRKNPFTAYKYDNRLPNAADNYGFNVELASENCGAMPLDRIAASDKDIEEDIVRRLKTGDGIRLLGDDEDPEVGDTVVVIDVWVDIMASEYDQYTSRDGKVLTETEIRPGLIPAERVSSLGLDIRYTEKEVKELEKTVVSRLKGYYDNDYKFLPHNLLNNGETPVRQVFEFSAWGSKVRLYNFAGIDINDDTLAKITNALREMAQLTGGKVFDKVPVIAIADESYPRFNEVSAGGQSLGAKTINAYADGQGTIIINSRLLLEGAKKNNTEDESDLTVVGADDIESTLFHELSHAVAKGDYTHNPESDYANNVGWVFQRDTHKANIDYLYPVHKPKTGGAPSAYGRTDPKEDLAESTTALFYGGEWGKRVDDTRRTAIAALYSQIHSGFEGPSFIKCKQIPLEELAAHKLGLNPLARIAVRKGETHYIFKE